MELYKELLLNYLEREPAQVSFPNLKIDVSEIIELQCYQALQDIKAVIDDDRLNDEECFMKIEQLSISSNRLEAAAEVATTSVEHTKRPPGGVAFEVTDRAGYTARG